MTDPKNDQTYSEEETVARREAALKRMLATPHKPLQCRLASCHSLLFGVGLIIFWICHDDLR